ncbi:MFS general substrate transporter [Xylariaceae sp. FL0804]|nr:MFS general substrate transporter [Xylariaceae sp. FL0804]
MVGLLDRVLSRPTAKPYRRRDLADSVDEKPYLNADGHVDFAPGGDVENPHDWSAARRWYVTVASVLLVVNATFASSSPSGCFPSIAEEFGVSTEAAGLTITLFLLGYCAGPLVFAPLSEFYGRRWIFYSTFLLYLVFNFLCAFAPNFGSLLVGRFLTGTFVSAPLSNSPGVLADLWGPVERGNAMAVFSCMVWVGPALGPVVAGFLQLTKNWRWSFYVLLWLGAATLPFLFTIPETFGPVILAGRARRIRRRYHRDHDPDPDHPLAHVLAPVEAQGDERSLLRTYRVALTRPWQLLLDPISALCALYMSVVYCLLYMLFSIYPIVFQQMRGWNAGVGELPLIGTAVGAALGALVVVVDSRAKARKIREGTPLKPEDRLTLAMVGGVGFAVTMFWFAWTANFNSIHWAVPTLAGVFLGGSLMLIFVGYLNYLVDTYLAYAASAIAVNTVTRSACGAAAPLFTDYMFAALGVGGGGSLVGAVAALLAVIPFAFYRYGERIRVRSRFAPTPSSSHHHAHADRRRPDDEERQQQQQASREQLSGEADGEGGGRRTSRGSAPSPSSPRRSHSLSAGSTVIDEEAGSSSEKPRPGRHDSLQNALGEPREENRNFGHEG